MAAVTPSAQPSPWRRIFEDVRKAAGNRRTDDGVLGSINWLRRQMERRGANPNVVRNIIYRDKGKPADKRVLLAILAELWQESGNGPLHAPEIEVLLMHSGTSDHEVLQLLGREKRQAFKSFVGAVRSGTPARLLVCGRPGSGKTLLLDYVQEALETPPAALRLARVEFSSSDLSGSLTRLAAALGVASERLEARLVKIGTSGAFAVQADAQAAVARLLVDAARSAAQPLVLLCHVSQSLAGADQLGMAPLRLNTPEVPRVSASEWLWLSLFEPLSRLAHVSLLVSMGEVPARALAALGNFDGPCRLAAPSLAEARRFVRARLPRLPLTEQEALVQRAGRSFEELRTLTLLAEVREPLPDGAASDGQRHLEELARLATTSSDERLRRFLAALAVLSPTEHPTFEAAALERLRGGERLSELEQDFLDPLPGNDRYRAFSRKFARAVREQLGAVEPELYRELNRLASSYYLPAAREDPKGEPAARYLHHLFEARAWDCLGTWLERHSMPQALAQRLWAAAAGELRSGETFEIIAQRLAAHYVRLGSYRHPDAQAAFAALERSPAARLRAWATLQQAEGAVLAGQIEEADALLQRCPEHLEPLLAAEAILVRASVARWRSRLGEASALVEEQARPLLEGLGDQAAGDRLVRAKAALWAGLIAKDQGDLPRALDEFELLPRGDELIDARAAFQRGDVLMRLGRCDAALAAFDEAVAKARTSEALLHEQGRYLSRRGTLHLRQGALAQARADFDAAAAALRPGPAAGDGLERTFWKARNGDEEALLLLAEGDWQQAIFVLERNVEVFAAYGRALRADSAFRVLRSTLRLARAYWLRAHGRREPFHCLGAPMDTADSADARHARELLSGVDRALCDHPDGRFPVLQREARLLASLLAVDASAGAAAACAALEASAHPYATAEGLAHLAAAQLRGGRAAEAEGTVAEAETALSEVINPAERSDLGLRACLAALAMQAALLRGAPEAAASRLAAALRQPDLAAHHQALLRAFGEAVEAAEAGRNAWCSPDLRALLRLDLEPLSERVRLPDALVARWLGLAPSGREGPEGA